MQEEILCYVGVSNINTVNIKDQTYDEIDESLRETAWCVFGSGFLASLDVLFFRRVSGRTLVAAVKMRLAQKCPVAQKVRRVLSSEFSVRPQVQGAGASG